MDDLERALEHMERQYGVVRLPNVSAETRIEELVRAIIAQRKEDKERNRDKTKELKKFNRMKLVAENHRLRYENHLLRKQVVGNDPVILESLLTEINNVYARGITALNLKARDLEVPPEPTPMEAAAQEELPDA